MPKRENPFGWSLADDVLQPKELDDIEAKKAVALLYDQVRAPILVAKGQGLLLKKSSKSQRLPVCTWRRIRYSPKRYPTCSCSKKYPKRFM